MDKLTFTELCEIIRKHNKERNIKQQYTDSKALECVAVVSQSNFNITYPIQSRSYKFRSDEKFFLPEMYGSSIFATSLDNSDSIRLDMYLNSWEIEYFYIKK